MILLKTRRCVGVVFYGVVGDGAWRCETTRLRSGVSLLLGELREQGIIPSFAPEEIPITVDWEHWRLLEVSMDNEVASGIV